jgi:hypothetical protein
MNPRNEPIVIVTAVLIGAAIFSYALFSERETIPSTYHLIRSFRLTNSILLVVLSPSSNSTYPIMICHVDNGVIIADRNLYVKLTTPEGKQDVKALIHDDRLGLGSWTYLDIEIYA